MTYEESADAVKSKLQAKLVDGWKLRETYFQVMYVRIAVSAEDDLRFRFLGMRSFLEKSSALFSSRVAKALDVRSYSCKSPSFDSKKTKVRRKASDSKNVKKGAERPSSGNDKVDVDSVQADIM